MVTRTLDPVLKRSPDWAGQGLEIAHHKLAKNWLRVPWSTVALALLIVAATLLRLRVISTPLERDEGEYAYAGQLLLQGIPPYQLAYNMKLPGTYFAYAMGMSLFGQSAEGIHIFLILINSITLLLLFFLGRELFGTAAGLAAAAVFAVSSASPSVLGMAAHANHFVILFIVPAVWLLWRALQASQRLPAQQNEAKARPRPLLFFGSGLLFGVGFLMKQQALMFLLFAIIWLIGERLRGWHRNSACEERVTFLQHTAAELSLLCAGMVLPFLATCSYLCFAGVFPAFWFWVFDYARQYVSVASFSDGIEYLRRYLAASSASAAATRLLAIGGLLTALLATHLRKQVFFVSAFALASFAAVSIGLFYRPHYFLLALPAMALLAGAGASLLGEAITNRFAAARWTSKFAPFLLPPAIACLAAASTLVLQHDAFFRLTPEQLSEVNYPANPFIEAKIAANYLRAHGQRSSTLAVIGSEPQLYFYSGLRSATGYLYTYPLMEKQSFASKMRDEMIHEVEAGKPDFLIRVNYENSWAPFPDSDRTVFKWCDEYITTNYVLAGYVARLPTGKCVQGWKNVNPATLPRQDCLAVYQRR